MFSGLIVLMSWGFTESLIAWLRDEDFKVFLKSSHHSREQGFGGNALDGRGVDSWGGGMAVCMGSSGVKLGVVAGVVVAHWFAGGLESYQRVPMRLRGEISVVRMASGENGFFCE